MADPAIAATLAQSAALRLLPAAWARPLRLLLLAHAIAVVVLLIGALPVRLAQLQTVCVEPVCPAIILVPADVAVLQQLGIGITAYALYHMLIELLLVVPVTLLWLLIYRRYSHVWVGALACAGLAYLGVLLGNIVWAWTRQSPPVAVLSGLLGEVGAAALLTLLFVFPDGHFVPRWTRAAAVALLALAVPYGVVAQFIAPGGGALHDLNALLFVLFLLLGSAAQVIRYRHTQDQSQRRQTQWVVVGVCALLLSVLLWFATMELFPFAPGAPRVAWNMFGMLLLLPLAALFPASLGLAILRYRLWAIDVIINRLLVYSGLTLAIGLLYTLVVGGLGALLQTRNSVGPALLAAALLAVVAAPLQARLQRAVNRLLYGRRDDPLGILTGLGTLLVAADRPARILPAYAEAIAGALRLPAVAIWTVDEQDGLTLAAHSGATEQATTQRLPLIYHDRLVGYLALAARVGEEAFSPADRRLLAQIATQTASAVSAVRLGRDLQLSRARLVNAREEERRRLRRDLHDGLGPLLASQGLKLSAARQLLDRRPDTARQLLDEVMAQNEQTVADVRRLIYGLRPPALDELGLAGAIAQEGRRVLGPVALTLVSTPSPLPALPAAVEVAAYRIVLEALTNVARHARAATCCVTLAADERLTITIDDDGIGLPDLRNAGVGLHAMRERAAELGGDWSAARRAAGGTRITTTLPLPEDDIA